MAGPRPDRHRRRVAPDACDEPQLGRELGLGLEGRRVRRSQHDVLRPSTGGEDEDEGHVGRRGSRVTPSGSSLTISTRTAAAAPVQVAQCGGLRLGGRDLEGSEGSTFPLFHPVGAQDFS